MPHLASGFQNICHCGTLAGWLLAIAIDSAQITAKLPLTVAKNYDLPTPAHRTSMGIIVATVVMSMTLNVLAFLEGATDLISARTCIAERQTLSGFSGDRFFSERLSWGDRHCSRTWRKDPGKMVALLGTGIAARRTGISVQPASGWGPSKEAPCKHGHWWSYLFKSRPECSLRYALHRSALSELQSCTGFLQGDFESPPCTDLEFRLAPVHLDFSG